VDACGGPTSKLFGSSHATGINVLFVDGAVRHVRYSVSAAAFRSISVRNDRSNYDPSDF
jgi:prepilin-type processing-associated H-X9-DG protein